MMVVMDLGLAGKTAVVLGATSGMGAAIARGLAAEGASVAVVGRRAQAARELASELGAAVAIPADITEPGAPQRILDQVTDTLGRVEVLVLNGGGPKPSLPTDFTSADAQDAVDLLLKPHIDLVSRVLPAMLEAGWGRIVAVGSAGVQEPIGNLTASNVGRAALAGYLKTLAGQVADQGVTVNMVLPGLIDTDRAAGLDQLAADAAGVSVEEARTKRAESIPAGRYGTPEEFAAVAVFLASSRASYVTGEQIRCDGGSIRHY